MFLKIVEKIFLVLGIIGFVYIMGTSFLEGFRDGLSNALGSTLPKYSLIDLLGLICIMLFIIFRTLRIKAEDN